MLQLPHPHPPTDYAAIFDRRGEEYHRAMTAQPLARAAEFRQMVALAGARPGETIADIPAGGGYLRAFLPAEVRLVSVETARAFLGRSPQAAGDEELWSPDLCHVPLPSGSLDGVLSLAGAHHLPDQPAFYREVWRLLKPGGRFVLADVREGSRVAAFLNEWLHAHNSLGHRGLFLGASTLPQLARCSFTDLVSAPRSYPWVFASPEAMASYCRSLFGADLADDAAILEGLRGGPGWDEEGGCCHLRWELQFISARKPLAAR